MIGELEASEGEIFRAGGTRIVSVLCSMRGSALHALEKHDQAARWFRLALRGDARNTDAFFALIDGSMLCPAEEASLVACLDIGEDDAWLHRLYLAHINKHDDDVQGKFAPLQTTHGLGDNAEVLGAQAACHYQLHDARSALALAQRAASLDPFIPQVTLVQVCSLVELRLPNELFLLAHRLVARDPNKALAWFAVGCYYLLVRKLELAQQYLRKATTIDPSLAAACRQLCSMPLGK